MDETLICGWPQFPHLQNRMIDSRKSHKEKRQKGRPSGVLHRIRRGSVGFVTLFKITHALPFQTWGSTVLGVSLCSVKISALGCPCLLFTITMASDSLTSVYMVISQPSSQGLEYLPYTVRYQECPHFQQMGWENSPTPF